MSNSDSHTQFDLERARFEFEKRKWEADSDYRSQEIQLKREEHRRSQWINPLVIAVFAAAAAAAGNAAVTFISTTRQAQIERERSDASQKLSAVQAEAALELERSKSEAARILEVVKTNDPDKAATNLRFLVETGLIADAKIKEKIESYLDKRKPGQGVSLNSQSSSISGRLSNLINCKFPASTDPKKILESFSLVLREAPFELLYNPKEGDKYFFSGKYMKPTVTPDIRVSLTVDLVKDTDELAAYVDLHIIGPGGVIAAQAGVRYVYMQQVVVQHLQDKLPASLGVAVTCGF